MFVGIAWVVNSWGEVVTGGPLASCTTACIEYVVLGSMPATRIDTVPPPAGAAALDVFRTTLSGPVQNSTYAEAPSGSVREKLATSALPVGVMFGEKSETEIAMRGGLQAREKTPACKCYHHASGVSIVPLPSGAMASR